MCKKYGGIEMIKKVTAYILAGILAVSNITLVCAGDDDFYTEDIAYEENFDNEADKTFGNEWTTVGTLGRLHPGGGNVNIESAEGTGKNGKDLSIDGGLVQLTVSGNIKLKGKSVISFDRYRSTQNAHISTAIYFSDFNNDDNRLNINWRNGMYIDGSFPTTEKEYTSGIWYHFDVVVDETMKEAYLYIDNKYIGSKDISAQYSDKNGYRFARFIFNQWAGSDLQYVDNIKIYEM